MVKEAGYIEKLDELVKVKKADESVLTTINDNELGYKKAKENLELLLKEIEKIEKKLKEKRQERKQIPIYKVKELTQVIKEISTIKKEYANKLDEKTYLEEFCKEKQKQNNEIKEETENQYKIYQENEIYIKAVEKISKKNKEKLEELSKKSKLFKKKEKEEEPAPEPTTKTCPFCYTEINFKATRCPNCTSDLK